MQHWSQRYANEWRAHQSEVAECLAMMVNQYFFVTKPLTDRDYDQLKRSFLADHQNILQFISGHRIARAELEAESNEARAMLSALHCLAMICWGSLYNAFYPDFEEDVIADVSAAEAAVAMLERFGLMQETLRGGKWTAEGIDMLNGKLR